MFMPAGYPPVVVTSLIIEQQINNVYMQADRRIKKMALLLILSIMMYPGSPVHGQLMPLPLYWKWKLGDDPRWSGPSFRDESWEKRPVGRIQSAPGYKDQVYAWYRIRVVIPSSLKASSSKMEGLKLQLGRIDDADQTFFNGKPIGQTGSFPPQYESRWDQDRIYTIPWKSILWDQENLIAVRVFSQDAEGIGLYQGPYGFGPFDWKDFVSAIYSTVPGKNDSFSTAIQVTNRGARPFRGKLICRLKDPDNRQLYYWEKHIALPAGPASSVKLQSPSFGSRRQPLVKIDYTLSEDGSLPKQRHDLIYITDPDIRIGVEGPREPVIKYRIADKYMPLPFERQLLRGYLGNRLGLNLEERLLKIDEAGIMSGYLERPGNHPWIGEHAGKFLESACNTWKYNQDARLKSQMDRIAYVLIASQLPGGYLGTYQPQDYWTSWDVWSHKYNLYGLLAYYSATGYQPALEACRKIGNLMVATFGNQPGKRNIILAGEHMGMAATSILDPMLDLYRYTGEKKYLDFCYYLISAWEQKQGPRIISTLMRSGRVNEVANAKAYEMLSNLVGLLKFYRVTGDTHFLDPVLAAWKDIISKRLYITGTASSMEYFQDDQVLPASEKDHIGEGCVTTTWIQLNYGLLAAFGDPKYLEEIERSLYNHLLGAENPQTGCVSYYTPLMDRKPYSCEITCCTSSVPRGIAMIPYFNIGTVDGIPSLMLYEPAYYRDLSVVTGKGRSRFSMEVGSGLIETGHNTLRIKIPQPDSFALGLRVPSWCDSFVATIADSLYRGKPGSYLVIKRLWNDGDAIDLSCKIPLQMISGGRSYPGQTAFQRGPQVLALDSGLSSLASGSRLPASLSGQANHDSSMVDLPANWIGHQVYGIALPDPHDPAAFRPLLLVPFADAGQRGDGVRVWIPWSKTP